MTPPSLPFAVIASPAHTLAAINWPNLMVGGTLTLFVVVCVLLVLTILIQKPQGGGLSGAFGAGASGSGQTAFGTKTGDALTWMTIGMFVIYLGAAIGMNYAMRPIGPTPPAAPAVVPAPGTGTGATTTPATNGAAPATKPADTTNPPATAPKTETTPPSNSTINVKPAEPGSTPVTPAPTPGTDTPANPPAANPPANPATPPTNPPANPPKP